MPTDQNANSHAAQMPGAVRDRSAGSNGERRIITVLFADVVNSTGLAEKLDPEDWTEIMNEAFPHLTMPIQRYGGSVARLMGDGLLAFFGSPVAHEDDPQRAILAGLGIIEATQEFARKVKQEHGLDFDVRVGINTGSVVVANVGSSASMEHTAMGDAVNIAARMQQTAEPGTVQLSGDTYRLVAPLIDVVPLGEVALKGKTEPVSAYRVTAFKTQADSLRKLRGASAPLVGRGQELDALKAAADQALQGRGQIVCLVGEAGLGKTRLLDELKAYWQERARPDSWEEMTGVPYDAGRPFGLFQNFARRMFEVTLDDAPETIDRKVHHKLDPLDRAPPEAIGLCSIAMQRVIAAKSLRDEFGFSSEAIKRDIAELMEPAFRGHSKNGPMVVMIDDIQWADPASVDLIEHLLALTDEEPIMIVCAMRPERQSPAWRLKLNAETNYPHRYLEIGLKPLDDGEIETLVSALLRIADLPNEVRDLILRKADGNPYFVEEIVRVLIEQGLVQEVDGDRRWKAGANVADFTIPDSLQALLVARIDRLGEEAKATLQMASVIGRSFYYRILQAISDSAMALDKDLRSLERVELLREAGRQPELEYIFKHELARDAAYATILNRKRREFHLRVAEAMETIFADNLEGQAHRLAQHFELAGEAERAKNYYMMAAEAAESVHAGPEAISHYEHALDAARQLKVPAAEIARLEAARAAVEMDHGIA